MRGTIGSSLSQPRKSGGRYSAPQFWCICQTNDWRPHSASSSLTCTAMRKALLVSRSVIAQSPSFLTSQRVSAAIERISHANERAPQCGLCFWPSLSVSAHLLLSLVG